MSTILRSIRNGAFAVAIAVGLAFGTTQALGGTPDLATLLVPCDSDPGTCPDPIEDCAWWCDQQGYYDGECYIPPNCCVCRH